MNQTIAEYNNPGSYTLTLNPGKYKFECWGASGGTGRTNGDLLYHGGHGSYVSGEILLEIKRTFYLFVGGKGANSTNTVNAAAAGGYNGGGNGGKDTSDGDDAGAGGGGATDIRLVGGTFDNINGLRSRIIVAAGGSGSAFRCYGAPGGGLNGFKVTEIHSESYSQSSVTQTNGYSLGRGESGRAHTNVASSGGGGGYYGGFTYDGGETPYYDRVASSGNSFISGHPNCNAVNENGAHTGSNIHYSQLYFNNTVMRTRIETYNSPLNPNAVGHYGDGFIRVTLLTPYISPTATPDSCGKCTNTCTIFTLGYSLIILFTTLLY
jgi:hypothetical protein